MNITEQQIKEWKEAEAKATPGPWETRFLHRAFQSARKDPSLVFYNPSESDWPDAEFIALARNNFGPLLEAYERLLKDNGPSFDDAVKIAVGCLDYGGGHHSDGKLEAFHHGIETVICALKSVSANGFDSQSRALHTIGNAATKEDR